jgi:hypothetical protein
MHACMPLAHTAGVGLSHAELEHLAEGALGGTTTAPGGSSAKKDSSKWLGGESRVGAQGAFTHVALAFEGPAAGNKG